MRDILIAKADYCPAFKSTLINSGVKDLVECTQDLFWASGLAPRLTATTKPSFYPGSNMLGNILDSVRRDLIKGAVISSITETDIPRPQHLKQLPSDSLPTEPLNTSLPPPEPLSSAPIPSEPLPSEQLPSAPFPSEQLRPEPLPSEPLPLEPIPSDQLPTVSIQPVTLPSISFPLDPLPSYDVSSDPPPAESLPCKSHSTKPSSVKQSTKYNKNIKSPKSGTITSLFVAIVKRKLSPEKEADTAQENPKSHRSDNHNS